MPLTGGTDAPRPDDEKDVLVLGKESTPQIETSEDRRYGYGPGETPAWGCPLDTSLARPEGAGVPYETGLDRTKLNQCWREKKGAPAPRPLHTQIEPLGPGVFERAGRRQGDMRRIPDIEDPLRLGLNGHELHDAIRPELCAMCSDTYVGNVPEGQGEYCESDRHHPSLGQGNEMVWLIRMVTSGDGVLDDRVRYNWWGWRTGHLWMSRLSFLKLCEG